MINGRFSLIPAVYLIFVRNNQILLIRRFQTGYMDGYYGLPSGHIDGDEPADQAAIREAKEEVGITLQPEELEFAFLMHRRATEGNHERMDLFFKVKSWQGEPINAEPEKCDELLWTAQDDLPAKVVPEVKFVLDQIKSGKLFGAYNF